MKLFRSAVTRVWGSIHNKLLISFYVIVALFFIYTAFSSYNNEKLNALYEQTLTRSMVFNEFYNAFERVNSSLEYIAKKNTTDGNDFDDSVPGFLNVAETVEAYFKNTPHHRNAVDLMFMTQTYAQRSKVFIDLTREKDYRSAVAAYEEARFTASLISEQYSRIYKSTINETIIMREQAAQFRNIVRYINLSLMVLFILTGIALTRFITAHITKPIKRLAAAANKFSLSSADTLDFDKISTDRSDEIGGLARAFGDMAEKNAQQFAETEEKAELQQKLNQETLKYISAQKLLKESEFKALQARINPHFLFNSLNLIARLAYLENAQQTASIMESFSELLRYNLRNFNKSVTIADEVDNIKNYIEIQQKRFGQRIVFELSVDARTEEAVMPCLVLQPFIENSIIHGVGLYTENAVTGLNINIEGKRVLIRAYDNGVGLDDVTIAKIIDMASSNIYEDSDSSIGLTNVMKRLSLFFNDDVSLTINSIPGVNTEFIISIPFINQ